MHYLQDTAGTAKGTEQFSQTHTHTALHKYVYSRIYKPETHTHTHRASHKYVHSHIYKPDTHTQKKRQCTQPDPQTLCCVSHCSSAGHIDCFREQPLPHGNAAVLNLALAAVQFHSPLLLSALEQPVGAGAAQAPFWLHLHSCTPLAVSAVRPGANVC